MYINDVDKEKLKAIYAETISAKKILDYFKTCSADKKIIEINEVSSSFQDEITRQDIVKLFQDLDKLKIGSFKVGRRTQKSRFISEINIVDIGEILEEDISNDIRQKEIEKKTTQKISRISENELGDLRRYPFLLRANLEISLELPVDLTNADVERLYNFIKTIPLSL
jgi:hypothetical protein